MLLGGVVVAAEMGKKPELVVAVGDAGPGAELLRDGQRGVILPPGGGVIATPMGEYSQLDADEGSLAGARWNPAKRLLPQLAFGGPCSPGAQLAAG